MRSSFLHPLGAVLGMSLAAACCATAQDAPIQKQPVVRNDGVLQPRARVRLPELSDVVQAKISEKEDEAQLVVMVESYRTEKRQMQVTMFRQEERRRMVPGKDGELVEQTYTVRVPFMENKEVDTQIPAGRKPTTISLETCQFYTVDGERVGRAEVTERLATLKPVFLLDGAEGELPEIPVLLRQVLREDCLIVMTPEVIRERRLMVPLAPAGAIPLLPPVLVPAAERLP